MAFHMEHCLYVILCTFLQSQCQQQVERVFGDAVSTTILYRIVYILNVVNPHKSDFPLIELTGALVEYWISEMINLYYKKPYTKMKNNPYFD